MRNKRLNGSRMSSREALLCFYHRTLPQRWTNGTNWDTEANLSRWYGVTIDVAGHPISLNLNDNRLEGTLPDDAPLLRYLIHLKELSLSTNLIHGEIGSFLRHFSSLTSLNLAWNQLTGVIPKELCILKQLVVLRLDNNRLTGEIPTYLNTLFNLRYIDLSNNHLTGITHFIISTYNYFSI